MPLPIRFIASWGQEVVIAFFLLSGFLIFYSLNHKYFSFKVFLRKRFQRIYIPFLVSLIVSLIVAYLTGTLSKLFTWSDLIGNLLLLQDFGSVKPGTWFYPFLGNLPLWTLSYQWWFYLLVYPAYRFLPKSRNRMYLVLLFSSTAYLIYWIWPNQVCLIFSYFILEWLGIELGYLYCQYRTLTWQNTKHCLISMSVMVLLTIVPFFWISNLKFGYYPFLMFRHFFMGFLFLVASILGFYLRDKISIQKIFSIFTKISPITYGLYVLHYPILVQWGLRNAKANGQVNWVEWGIAFIILIILSYVAEIQLPKLFKKFLAKFGHSQ